MLKVSAPGKVHLIGEHAVVYGEPAIIAAIGKRTSLKLEKSDMVSYLDRRFDESPQEWSVSDVIGTARNTMRLWDSCNKSKNFTKLFEDIKRNRYENYRKSVVGIVLDMLGIKGGVSGEISSGIPIGAGLGSSSSLSVCLSKGISDLYGKNISLSEVNNIAFELEKIIHGTPSGGDNTASCFGGLTWFVKGTPNTILSLKQEIPHKLENFILVHTVKPEKTTGEMVQLVRNMEEKKRNIHIKRIGKAAHEMRQAIKTKNMKNVVRLMNIAQKNLARLGVSVREIDDIHKAVAEIGGAAKLCGAGGGGIMLCYHQDRQKLVDTIASLGFTPMETSLGDEGVRVE